MRGMSTVASVSAPMGARHRAQREVSLREPNLGLSARALGEVTCPILGQSKSAIANIRATLEGQCISRGRHRT